MPTAAPSNRWAQLPSLLFPCCQQCPLAERDSRSRHVGFLDTTASLPQSPMEQQQPDTRIYPGFPIAPHGKRGSLTLSKGLGVPLPPSGPRGVLCPVVLSGSRQEELLDRAEPPPQAYPSAGDALKSSPAYPGHPGAAGAFLHAGCSPVSSCSWHIHLLHTVFPVFLLLPAQPSASCAPRAPGALAAC